MDLKNIIEAALFAAGGPLSVERLEGLFAIHEQPGRAAIHEALEALREEWSVRGVELCEVGSGYRFQVKSEVAPWVSRLWEERPSRYSRALLETLALIAYRQPITRAEIEEIRGVSVSTSIVKTLQEREWIRVVGHRDVPGRPAMYATTRQFLDYFGLASLDELPTLAELRDIDTINAELELGLSERSAEAPPIVREDDVQGAVEETVLRTDAGSETALAPPAREVSATGDDGAGDEMADDELCEADSLTRANALVEDR
jgi:segregation and condensation protein B